MKSKSLLKVVALSLKGGFRSLHITCKEWKGKLSHLSVIPDFNGADEIAKTD